MSEPFKQAAVRCTAFTKTGPRKNNFILALFFFLVEGVWAMKI
jgi:hypothetical protein